MFFVGLSKEEHESKTTKLLKKVLNDESLVYEYEETQRKLKKDTTNKASYMKTVAKIQVKLNLTLEKEELRLKEIERQSFEANQTLSVYPENKDNKEKYINSQNTIKIITCLIHHFNKTSR